MVTNNTEGWVTSTSNHLQPGPNCVTTHMTTSVLPVFSFLNCLICDLFNNSISDYIQHPIVNNEHVQKTLWPNVRHYHGIFLEGLRKPQKPGRPNGFRTEIWSRDLPKTKKWYQPPGYFVKSHQLVRWDCNKNQLMYGH